MNEVTKAGSRAIAVPGDVSNSAEVARMFVETTTAYGALDVLVNNAAVYKFGPLEAMTEEEFRREFNTNVLGPVLMIREALNYFGPRGGSIGVHWYLGRLDHELSMATQRFRGEGQQRIRRPSERAQPQWRYDEVS